LEAAVYLAILFPFLARSSVRNHLSALPRPHQAILATIFTALLAGHLARDARATFPFAAWTMYGTRESPDTLVYYRSEGIDQQQVRITIDEAQLFPAVDASSLAATSRNLAAAVMRPEQRAGAPQKLTAWLTAIGDAYNRAHGEHPVEALELVRYSLSLRDQGKSAPSARPVWRVRLGSHLE
jgi:hypothetical protein